MDQNRIRRAIDAVIDAARNDDFAVSICVVDPSGVLAAFHRMEGCLTGPVEVAQKKARTASLFGTDSVEFGSAAQPGGAIYSIEFTNGGLISFGGGVTLRESNSLVGAIGVAGATVDMDEELARIGAAAF